jgi:hypothetical protein
LWRLGEDVNELAGDFHLDQANFAVLDRFMREVLADVDMLSSADHEISPL